MCDAPSSCCPQSVLPKTGTEAGGWARRGMVTATVLCPLLCLFSSAYLRVVDPSLPLRIQPALIFNIRGKLLPFFTFFFTDHTFFPGLQYPSCRDEETRAWRPLGLSSLPSLVRSFFPPCSWTKIENLWIRCHSFLLITGSRNPGLGCLLFSSRGWTATALVDPKEGQSTEPKRIILEPQDLMNCALLGLALPWDLWPFSSFWLFPWPS